MATAAPAKYSLRAADDHMIAHLCGDPSGPTLVVFGSIHGNEPSGTACLRKILPVVRLIETRLRGRVFFIAGNVRALREKVRFIDSDLNRHWTKANLARSGAETANPAAEDAELFELNSVIQHILDTAEHEVYALDLHSTSADGLPFATVGDTLRNRHFAQMFPVRMLLGIEEQLEGTLLEYLNNKGVVTLGFEGGQHDAAATIANHEALVWLALVNAGIAVAEDIPDIQIHRQILEISSAGRHILEVRHREAVAEEDNFVMNPGFKNFDSIQRGQRLAQNRK
jgi:predicted deacylase